MTLRPVPTVLLYDPAVSSLNIGDHMISESCDRVLAPLLAESFVVRVSSHLPVSPFEQQPHQARSLQQHNGVVDQPLQGEDGGESHPCLILTL